MPISNPIVNLITNPTAPLPPPVVLLETADPIAAPISDRIFWLNIATRKLWLAVATNSVSDWVAIGGDSSGVADWSTIANKPDTFPVDIANILNKILVQNGQVLTTDDNIIFED